MELINRTGKYDQKQTTNVLDLKPKFRRSTNNLINVATLYDSNNKNETAKLYRHMYL